MAKRFDARTSVRILGFLFLLVAGSGLAMSSEEAFAMSKNQGSKSRESWSSPAFAIEDSSFFFSPGDRILLRWWGVGSGSEELIVNTRWELVVPDLGKFNVRNTNLADFRDTMDTLLRKRSRATIVDVQIIGLAPTSVQITGLVPIPGIHEIPQGSRLSKALEASGINPGKLIKEIASGTPPRAGDRYKLPSIRRVGVIRSRSRDTLWCDLARAYNGGELSQDPVLFAGDQIWVIQQGAMVALTGDAPLAGYLERIPGESLGQILRSVGIANLPSAVVRDSTGRDWVLDVDEILPPSVQIIALNHLTYPKAPAVVWIDGFIKSPGGYALTPGLTARELVRIAGGVNTSNENSDSAVILSIKRGWIWLNSGRKSGIESESQYSEVKLAWQGYLNRISRHYANPDQHLQPGDSVVVQQAEMVVWVGGQVRNSGFVPWVRGSTLDDYVAAAGGYANRPWPSRAVIYDTYAERRTEPGDPIRPGSTIVVPERKYIYPDQWVQIIATVATLLIGSWSVYLQASK